MQLHQLPLKVKLAIIDELALEHASLKALALTTRWETECHDRIRKYLFQNLSLPPLWTNEQRPGVPERKTTALIDVLASSPQIRNFVKSMVVSDSTSDGYLSHALPDIMSGMSNLSQIFFHAVDLVSIFMPAALISCSSLCAVHFWLCRFTLFDVFHLLRALPNVEELYILWASVADYEDGHSMDHCIPLDFGADTVRSRFGIPSVVDSHGPGLFLKDLIFAGLSLNPLCMGMHGCGSVHLLDFLCTSGLLRGAEKMSVEFNFGDTDDLRRLQALMNMARSEFSLKNVGCKYPRFRRATVLTTLPLIFQYLMA